MAIPGWYGKLPALGDFASRRLPQEFIQPWDAWLQQALAQSQAMLGEAWLPAYLTCHIWRFILAKDCLDSHRWSGILVPSVDRVGRYFPLCIVTKTDSVELTPTWFATLDESARIALSGSDVEAFDCSLANEATILLGQEIDGTLRQFWSAGNEGESVWFLGSPAAPDHCLQIPGMPGAQAYARMLTTA